MKGWTVVTKVTRDKAEGLAGREVYLHNKKHKNHVKTEAIVQLYGSTQTMAKMAHNGAIAAAIVKDQGKGGRPPESYAVEFTLNLPKGYRPTTEQWQKIAQHTVKKMAESLGIKPEVLGAQSYITLHQQDQTPNPHPETGKERDTGDHIHMVVGKFLPNGVCLRDLQRKTMTRTVKDAFNFSTLAIGCDWQEYAATKLQAQEHANKKRVPTWRVKAARENEALDRRVAALSEKVARMEDRADEIEKRERSLKEREAEINEKMAELSEKMAEQKIIDKLLKNFENQGNKWLLAYEKGDKTQMNRQKNRLNKTLTALDAFGLLSEDAATVEAVMAMSRVELMMDKVNHCKPETLVKPTISRPKLR
ncbi:hypothetical protein D6L34_25375 [Vibrio parahaemolyticus]|jgi:hypothetical protein|nr:hypothetical protein [Vibrio parahaemolyticus]EGR1629902.1 hypothetical protein [Vibrio parahaemolyticus]EGR1650367.1 hypothetical protein [Vibrio parahaemolyticus]